MTKDDANQSITGGDSSTNVQVAGNYVVTKPTTDSSAIIKPSPDERVKYDPNTLDLMRRLLMNDNVSFRLSGLATQHRGTPLRIPCLIARDPVEFGLVEDRPDPRNRSSVSINAIRAAYANFIECSLSFGGEKFGITVDMMDFVPSFGFESPLDDLFSRYSKYLKS